MDERPLKAGPALILVLAAAGFGVKQRPALASAKSHIRPRVTAISISNSRGGTVAVNISTSRSTPYQILRLSNPKRLVVDLKGAWEGALQSVYPAQSRILKRVRVGQWKSNPPIVRVVADLKGTPAYRVDSIPTGIRIELKSQTRMNGANYHPDSRRSRSSGIVKRSSGITRQNLAFKSPFTVQRFQDLSASLTSPDIPPGDRLIPVLRPRLSVPTPKTSTVLASVSGVSIMRGRDGRTDVDIASTRPVPYRIFQLSDPFRLVIDLKGARDASSKRVYPVGSAVLKRIRIGQWRSGNPSVVRIVADLRGYPIFDVYARRPGIRIDLRPRPQFKPIIRNPFEFAAKHSKAHRMTAIPKPTQPLTAVTNSPAPGNSLSDLKVIGYLREEGAGTQAILSDRANIYFVPKGSTIENRFRVLAISANAVEVQDMRTLQSRWLAYTP